MDNKIKYLYVCVGSAPTPTPNLEAVLIARYPTKMRATAKSTLTVIGLFSGPSHTTRVW